MLEGVLAVVTTRLNTVGQHFGTFDAVHAMTDVTGFGLLGHLLEICRGSGLAARIRFDRLPVLPAALVLTPQGIGPGAIERNWASYGHEIRLSPELPDWAQRLLCDPQTSGGLLVACAPEAVAAVLEQFHAGGFPAATVIGALESGDSQVVVE